MGNELQTFEAALDLQSLPGKPITEFLVRFCKTCPGLASMRFATYRPEPKLTERLNNILTPEEERLRDEAVSVCHENGIPFWDALFGICMRLEKIPERFLEAAKAHSSNTETQIFSLAPQEITTSRIMDMVKGLKDDHGLVVSSRLAFGPDKFAHIPMLDFRCKYSTGSLQAIRKILMLLGQRSGVIVESGRSYHFYGTSQLSESNWTKFMAHALLFAPVIDPRYVAHRLADGEGRLKIASSRAGNIPIVAEVHSDVS